jgi:CAAX protease family protein
MDGVRSRLATTAPRPAVGWTVLALVGSNVLIGAYMVAVDPPASADPFGDDHASTLTVAFMGIVAIVLAPIVEETFFRGFLYGGLRRSWPVPTAATVAASLFGLTHWSFGLGSTPLIVVPALAIFGLAACLLYERTGSLYPGMALHAYTNAGIFAASGFVPLGVPFGAGLIAVLVCLVAPAVRRRRPPAATAAPSRP